MPFGLTVPLTQSVLGHDVGFSPFQYNPRLLVSAGLWDPLKSCTLTIHILCNRDDVLNAAAKKSVPWKRGDNCIRK